MFEHIVNYFKEINSNIQNNLKEKNFTVSINGDNQVIIENGKVLGDKIEILSHKLELEKDFKISISYDGNIDNISSSAGNITVTTSVIKKVNNVSGDITINGNIKNCGEIKTVSGGVEIDGDVDNIDKISTVSGNVKLKGKVNNIRSNVGNINL